MKGLLITLCSVWEEGPGGRASGSRSPVTSAHGKHYPLLLPGMAQRENKSSSLVHQSHSLSPYLATGESSKRHQAPTRRPGTLGPSYFQPAALSWLTSLPSCFWHFQDGPSFLTSRLSSQASSNNASSGQLSLTITKLLPQHPLLAMVSIVLISPIPQHGTDA